MTTHPTDEQLMARAIEAAWSARRWAAPNPWVGAALLTADRQVHTGATSTPPGPHAEVHALAAAGTGARGATIAVTLEPCAHHGRTPPCADALIAAGVSRVLVGVLDPDRRVAGRGVERLRHAGIEVVTGVGAGAVEAQLLPYLHQRRTGRPWVVLKLAATLDGRTAAADGTSRWITGAEARADVHRLRAESDAILVGAGTVRADDPSLTVREVEGRDPRRIVLGTAPSGAKVHPCTEMSGDLGAVLDSLGRDGVVQLLVEGGATVAGDFHRAGLVDHYCMYLAPVLMGGEDGAPVLRGPGAASITDASRLERVAVTSLGGDLRIDLRRTGPVPTYRRPLS